jgi:alpha,alpha-trehalase
MSFEEQQIAPDSLTIEPLALGVDDPGQRNFHMHMVEDLFTAVASARPEECNDGMMLVDSELRVPIEEVSRRYEEARQDPNFGPDQAWRIWKECFDVPKYARHPLQAADQNGRPLEKYLQDTWQDLSYHPKDSENSTLIGTRNPHLRAGDGGRYNVGYYWDLEVAVRGLAVDTMKDPSKLPLMRGIVQNIADIIDRFGYVPNGMRTHYAGRPARGGKQAEEGRSQPLSFFSMVEQLDQVESYLTGRETNVIEDFLPQVVKEYEWWTRGEQGLEGAVGRKAVERVVHYEGFYVGRHFSASRDPRAESLEEDLKTAAKAPWRDPGDVFQNLIAGAEQGTDYDPVTQCLDPTQLATIDVLSRIPVQNNVRLAQCEAFIAAAHERAGRSKLAAQVRHRFERRVQFIQTHMWNKEAGEFRDLDWVRGEQIPYGSITMVTPVAAGFALPEQKLQVSQKLVDTYLLSGGFATSELEVDEPEQWQRGKGKANGWAGQQIDAVDALQATAVMLGERHYAVAAHIAMMRWLRHNRAIYKQYGTIAEKIDVASEVPKPGYSGEYPTQGGFGWSRAAMIIFAERLRQRRERTHA